MADKAANATQCPDSHYLTKTVVLHCKTAQTIMQYGPFDTIKRAVLHDDL